MVSSGEGVLEVEEDVEEAEEEVGADVLCGIEVLLVSCSGIGRRYQEVNRSITEYEAASKEEVGEAEEVEEEEGGRCGVKDEEVGEEEEGGAEDEEAEEEVEEEVEEEEQEGGAEEEVVAGVGSSEMTLPRLSRRGVGRK